MMATGVEQGYAECAEVVRRHAGNFRYAFPFLPFEKRRAISAVYAVSRRADDIADGPGPAETKAETLDELRGAFREAVGGGRAEDLVLAAAADAVERFRIPVRPFEDLFDGVKQDLTVTRYGAWADLEGYCYRVASSVGLICLEVFTYSDPAARDRAAELGKAMQVANIVRDVAEDARRGRIYLPQDEMREAGVREEDVLQGRNTPELAALVRRQIARARGLFEASRPLIRLIPRHARSCPAILARLYGDVLLRIERGGCDVFNGRVGLSRPRKAWLAFSGLVGSLL